MAQNLNALSPGSAFTQVKATPEVHFGGVCEGGVTCTGNRDLFDDFGVAASPTTGLASIIYSDDQFHPNAPNTSGCDASTSNSSSCTNPGSEPKRAAPWIFAKRRGLPATGGPIPR